MIILGTSSKTKTLDSGQFYCPRCQTVRTYERKQARPYFSAYFIPLFPIGAPTEFIECQTCKLTYKPEVLTVKPAETKADLASLINSAKSQLEAGYPIEYFVRDLNSAGLKREVAWNIVNNAIGTERHVCKNCDLSYAKTVTTCRECQQPLNG
ncbi:MAG TPA: zinc-ribbon domain-containing protein [Phototrophicaceae bacterium]|nr:zinc-ribbon domain-containing protein [Phototrophicaceae bacterium]